MSKSAETGLAELFEAARAAQGNAYAPYSRFKVGAALRAESATLYSGANVENAAYPEGVCAETSAISAMARAGERRIARNSRHRRRRGAVHALRRLPPAHPRILGRRDEDPRRRARGRASGVHAGGAAPAILRPRSRFGALRRRGFFERKRGTADGTRRGRGDRRAEGPRARIAAAARRSCSAPGSAPFADEAREAIAISLRRHPGLSHAERRRPRRAAGRRRDRRARGRAVPGPRPLLRARRRRAMRVAIETFRALGGETLHPDQRRRRPQQGMASAGAGRHHRPHQFRRRQSADRRYRRRTVSCR